MYVEFYRMAQPNETSSADEGEDDHDVSVPCLPPIEIRKDATWLLTLYEPDAEESTVIGSESTRMEALREGKNLMDDEGYPCLVLWSATSQIQDAYWNPLFEELQLRYDPMLEAWVLVPAEGHYLFDAFEDKALGRERGRELQLQYDFKEFVVYRQDGKKQQRAKHHFVASI